MPELLAYEFVQNAVMVAILASLLCGLVGTFVVVKRLVFIGGGVSHAAFGGLGLCHYLGLPPMLGAAAAALLTALLIAPSDGHGGRTRDARIGILWAVGMAVGVLFIARTPGYAPNLASYLFGDILAVSREVVVAMSLLVALVLAVVVWLFRELVAVAFDEEFARVQGLPVRGLLLLLMAVIALSVVLLIQAVGAILSIALLTIPPAISLGSSRTIRGVMIQAAALGLVMTLGGLALSFYGDLPSGPTIVLLGFALLLVAGLKRRLTGLPRGRSAAAVAVAAALGAAPVEAQAPDRPSHAPTIGRVEWLGEAVVHGPAGGPRLGGLSGITRDVGRGSYLVISDDRADHGPARFYTVTIDLTDGRLDPGDVRVVGQTALTLPDGSPFGKGGIDPEGLAITSAGKLFVASEGDARAGLPPFLREFSLDGRQRRELPLDVRYRPRRDGQSGVRNNLALESAALTPDDRWFFSATENALVQDGPLATVDAASPGRILRFDVERGVLAAEYLYWVEPVAEPSPGGFTTAGLVELLALDQHRLIALERSFSFGAGNTVRLWEVDLREATDIRPIERLAEHRMDAVRPARKRLLLDVGSLGIEPDNLEGMTFGPPLADGTRTLLLVADDNFNPQQRSQLLAFALHEASPTIAGIQGAAHRSPHEGDRVRGVSGVVTAVDPDPDSGGFWMQTTPGAEDDDPATSEGVFVASPSAGVDRGDRVVVDGVVREVGFRGALTVTTLTHALVVTDARGVPVPEPVTVGAEGRRPPTVVIDDDALRRFDPCCDGIDFFESLEGMRVRVERPVAVSGTSRYDEIVVLADGGAGATLRSRAGGIVVRPGDANPERIVLASRLAPEPPVARTGDLLRDAVVGVLDYSFGNFKVQVDRWPSVLRAQTARSPEPPVVASATRLSVASYNVLNLDGADPEGTFGRIARSIVDDLHSPDLLGLQEIQDDNGSADDGVTSAAGTIDRLLAAILDAGGPRYDYRQIDPEHDTDGGQPHGNIRVVWLYRPDTVRWTDRGAAGPLDATEVLPGRAGPRLSLSPGRIAPRHPAFAADPARGWEGGRKCLAGEVEFRGKTLFLVNCHLKSKRGDDGLFGNRQPPRQGTEEQRSAQARQVASLMSHLLAADPEALILVLGDMNEHEFRAPMRLLTSDLLENLTERVPPEERYSYNSQGNSQLLDHVLASRALARRNVGVTIVHSNADRADAVRASDHDPVLAWFDLD